MSDRQSSRNSAADALLDNKDLYCLLLDIQNGITAPGHASMANGVLLKIDAARKARRCAGSEIPSLNAAPSGEFTNRKPVANGEGPGAAAPGDKHREAARLRKLLGEKKLREMDREERALVAHAAMKWAHSLQSAELDSGPVAYIDHSEAGASLTWVAGPGRTPLYCARSHVGKSCPYCTSDNPAIRSTYYDQTCAGCVKRMGQP
jgi:hypothetical protein